MPGAQLQTGELSTGSSTPLRKSSAALCPPWKSSPASLPLQSQDHPERLHPPSSPPV
ncbi:hypothetical protein LDENG_00225030 [Lucifuga dentata]|nr:hypothetical protein LDENG_00225030 [Lucifuga dentata]